MQLLWFPCGFWMFVAISRCTLERCFYFVVDCGYLLPLLVDSGWLLLFPGGL